MIVVGGYKMEYIVKYNMLKILTKVKTKKELSSIIEKMNDSHSLLLLLFMNFHYIKHK
ncbi:hypothetical protein HNP21_002448 [Bacillus aryabhattai]|uniref:Uncharacterized protein n=1 Tax=Priestia aryabhattai TaxID=412384 RepID=A0A7W3NAB6_PRIAR|nr:hypothetical protein [Priestia aryabhattai]